MAKRDVELIIKARNEASRAIDDVNASLDDLQSIQEKIKSSVKGTETAFTGLSSSAKELGNAIKGLETIDRAERALDDAAKAVERLQQRSSQAAQNLQQLQQQFGQARTNVDTYENQVRQATAAVEQQQKAVRAIRDRLREIEPAYNRANKSKQRYNELERQGKELTLAQEKALRAANETIKRNGAEVSKLRKDRDAEQRTLAGLTNNLKSYQTLLRGATTEQEKLSRAITRQNAQQEQATANLREGRAAFEQIEASTKQARAAMQQFAGGQTRADLERMVRVLETMNRYTADGQSFGSARQTEELRKQREAVRETEERWRLLQNEIKRYATEARASGGATAEQTAQIGRLAAAARQIKQEYREKLQTLRQMGGASQSTFRQWARSTNEAAQGTRRLSEEQRAAIESLRRKRNEIKGTTAEAERLDQALRRFSTGAGFASPEVAARLQRQRQEIARTREDWATLENQIKQLAQTIRQSGGATERQSQELQRLRAAARAAKETVQQQTVALGRLQGQSQTTYRAWTQASDQTVAGIRRVTAETQRATSALGRKRVAVGQLSGAAQQLQPQFRTLFDVFNTDGRQALTFVQRLRGEFLALTTSVIGVVGAYRQLGNVFDAFRTVEAAENRLNVVFQGNLEGVRKEMDFLTREAQRLGVSFGTLSNSYSKFAVAARNSEFSLAGIREIFQAITEAGRVNKLTADDMKLVFLAIEQMISKGKVQTEELRRQLGERLPGAFNLFAQSIGVTAAELDKMLDRGEVFATEEVMLQFAARLREVFGPSLETALQSTTVAADRLGDAMFQALLRVGEGGFIEELTKLLRQLDEQLRSREARDFFLALGNAAGQAVRFVALLADNIEGLAVVAGGLIAIRLGRYLSNVGRNLATFVVTSVNANRAVEGSVKAFRNWGAVTRSLNGHVVRARASVAALQMSVVAVGQATTNAARAKLLWSTAMATAQRAALGLLNLGRGILAVFGGIPGILLAIGTYLVFDWATQVDDATQALDEHRHLMGLVITAYETLSGKVDDWRQGVEGVTVDQLDANFLRQQDRMRKALEEFSNFSLDSFTRTGRGVDAATRSIMREVDRYKRALESGEISVVEFSDAVAVLYDRIRDLNARRAVQELLALGREYGETQRITEEAAISTVEFGSTLESAQQVVANTTRTMRDLSEQIEETVAAFDPSVIEEFENALDQVTKAVPILREEFEQLQRALNLEEGIKNLERLSDKLFSEEGFIPDNVTRALQLGRTQLGIDGAGGIGSIIDRIIQVESGGRANARNPLSSATGLGQFIESTWLRLFRQNFPNQAEGMSRQAILALRENAEISRRMTEIYIRENSQVLQRYGHDINAATIYLAHFLGAGNGRVGATGLLEALRRDPNTPVEQFTTAAQRRANPTILGPGKTAQDVYNWAVKKMGVTQDELAVQREISTIEQRRADQVAQFNERQREGIENTEFQIEQERRRQQGLEREAAIQEAIRNAERDAARAGVELSEEQRQKIIETTGALFDQRNARDENAIAAERAAEADAEVNRLMAIRRELMQQIQILEEQGNDEALIETREELERINEQLRAAIENANNMWEAVGGAQAESAIARLRTMNLTLQQGSQQAMFDWKKVGDLFGNGLVNAFDRFSQAVAEGKNIGEAAKEAFLQFAADFLRQIARMIIEQAIFNALSAFGMPTSRGAGIFHGGGIAGAANRTRSVNPAIFSNAVRYHSGGIAGLRPNEVPAILQRGEEVLTRSDPRHMMNGGGADSAQPGGNMNVKVVNAIDAGSFIDAGMNSSVGERAVLNFIRANSGAVKNALGV